MSEEVEQAIRNYEQVRAEYDAFVKDFFGVLREGKYVKEPKVPTAEDLKRLLELSEAEQKAWARLGKLLRSF
ncbi:MAG: hypothetical protein ACE5LG_07770 [Anaerolineae bacterium]